MEFEFWIHQLINFLYAYLIFMLCIITTGYTFQYLLYLLELDSPIKEFIKPLIKHFINTVFERLFGVGLYVSSSQVD
jgi:hypothetical protein